MNATLVRRLLAPALAALLLAATAPAQGRDLQLEDLFRGVDWTGPTPRAAWVGDGNVLAYRVGDTLVHFDPAQRAQVPPPSPEAAPSEARVTVERGTRVVLVEADGTRRVLVEGSDPKQLATLAPGGRWVSFVDGPDLALVSVADGARWDLGADDPELLHGVLDWVYQEELYGRGDFRGHWWSPSGDAVAFLRLDQRAVPTFTIVDHVPSGGLDTERGVEVETMRYPKAGDPNPTAALAVAHPADRRVVWADLSTFPDDLLVVRVGWTPDGSRVVATIQDRTQKNAWLVLVDPQDGSTRTIVTERSETFTERPDAPYWLGNGTFLWISHRTGYRHLYHYDLEGNLLEKLSDGDWEVKEVLRVDEPEGRIWFMGTRDGAIQRHLYATWIGEIDGIPRRTEGRGWHRVDFSADGRFFVDSWSNLDEPPALRVVEAETGEVVLDLARAPLREEVLRLPTVLFTVTARDGEPLDATAILPPAGRFEGPRPVFLDVYGGPDAPSVRDAWRVSTFHQLLAQRGAIVLQVNVRSASGRGHRHTATCYGRLGVQELADVEDAVDHAVRELGGDPERVAISGWSYGGFLAAYALTHSDRFALGLAGAGVYDWRLYDTIYTERYMGTPQENKAGYDETSVIASAGDLSGHLVLMHGTMDDNVHLQNTIQLADALQKAGEVDFELMLYANARHGVGSRQLTTYRWDRIKRYLGLTDPAPAQERRPAAAAGDGAAAEAERGAAGGDSAPADGAPGGDSAPADGAAGGSSTPARERPAGEPAGAGGGR